MYKQFKEVGPVTLSPRVSRRKTASKAIGVLLALVAGVTAVKAELIPGGNEPRGNMPVV